MQRWEVSGWLDEVEAPAPALDGDLDVDVCVIGGGLSGLSTALSMLREGLSVAVLEANVAGFGASGRNAGHLTPTIGKDLPTLAMLFGNERTRALVELAEHAVRHTERLIAELEIACDYEPTGNIMAAVHEKQFATIDKAARAAEQHGAAGEVLEPEQMRERGVPAAFLRGFLEPTGGILNPGKYVRGLRRAAVGAGAQLFEHSPVTRIDADRRVAVVTPAGRVTADHAVIATNASPRALGARGPDLARVQVQLLQTAPLTDAQLDALDWRSRAGIYTAHEILESYRLTADGAIVGGSKHIRFGYGDRDLPDVDGAVGERLEQVFRRRFPAADGAAIAAHWGGATAFSLDFLPRVGRTGPHRNVLYSIGYCGHGVAQASYAGPMIADLLRERDGPGAALWGRRGMPLPPEPFRWLVARALTSLFEWQDRRVDRAARDRRS